VLLAFQISFDNSSSATERKKGKKNYENGRCLWLFVRLASAVCSTVNDKMSLRKYEARKENKEWMDGWL